MSLNFFGTDCAQVLNFPPCPNVRNTHGSVGNTVAQRRCRNDPAGALWRPAAWARRSSTGGGRGGGMVAGESQLDESITAGDERGKYTGDIHNNVRHGVGTYE